MLFSGISFLYFFLPVVMILYFLVPGQFKNYVLLAGSLVFYAWGEPKYIILMVLTILCGYVSGLLMEKTKKKSIKKAVMILSVCLCLGILGIFKYADFFVESINKVTGQNFSLLNLALPIGISFYTFQLLSYIVDVYRGNTEAQNNPIKLAVYISMFPQLIAGPIVRYVDVKDKLTQRNITTKKISEGITRFSVGLGKKVLIANSLGEICSVYKSLDEPTVVFSWMYAIATGLQIYFDFSGYSDMAIGLGKMLGFDFPENFDYPFLSKSGTEFWRRWHMTLGSWFRDYLYFPMGGSRVKPIRHIFNLFVVWMATGLWHGASWNFVIWGLFFAIVLIIEKYGLLKLISKSDVVGHIYLLLLAVISFVIFDNVVISEGVSRIGYLFGIGGIRFSSYDTWFYLRDFGRILLIAAIGATKIPVLCVSFVKKRGGERIINLVEPLFNAVVLILATAFLVNGSFNPFLYFRF